ncbi:MAG: GAF domain-containing protein [Desulfobacteraceae bacterium]
MSSPQGTRPEIPPDAGADCAASVFAASHPLAERIKELNCLYGISNLLENHGVSLSWIMQRAVELIPAAWQYPQNACARILLDGQEYTSRNFKATPWRQSTPIVLNDEPVGGVDVCYLEAPPENLAGPFLEEEQRLLRAIAERLSKVLWLKRSEEALKESEARYRVLTEQVAVRGRPGSGWAFPLRQPGVLPDVQRPAGRGPDRRAGGRAGGRCSR